jgi:hypothetical protein
MLLNNPCFTNKSYYVSTIHRTVVRQHATWYSTLYYTEFLQTAAPLLYTRLRLQAAVRAAKDHELWLVLTQVVRILQK